MLDLKRIVTVFSCAFVSTFPITYDLAITAVCSPLQQQNGDNQESSAQPLYPKPQTLNLRFTDNFDSPKSQQPYSTQGKVEQLTDRLALHPGSTLSRTIVTDSHLKIQFDLRFPKPDDKNKRSEFKLWLDFETPDPDSDDFDYDYYIWFRQKFERGKARSAIYLVETDNDWDKKATFNEQVRKPFVLKKGLESGTWTLEFRYGFWTVTSPGKAQSYQIYDDSFAYPKGIVLESGKGIHQLKSLKLMSTLRPDPSKKQIQEINRLLKKYRSEFLPIFQSRKYDEAVKIAYQIQQKRLQLLGPGHPDCATICHDIALISHQLRDYKTAIEYSEKSIELKRQIFGSGHPSNAVSFQQLGESQLIVGNYEVAEELLLKGLEINKRVFGDRSFQFASASNALGGFYRQTGEFEKALPIYAASKRIFEQDLGQNSLLYLITLNNLAVTQFELRNYENAQELYEKMVAGYKEQNLTRHPNYKRSRSNLAMLYLSTNELQKALEIVESDVDLSNIQSCKNPKTLDVIASIYTRSGEYQKAIEVAKYSRSVRLSRGTSELGLAISDSALGVAYREMGQYDKSERFFQSTLKRLEGTYDNSHPLTIDALSNLSGIHFRRGSFDSAQKYSGRNFELWLEEAHRNSKVQTERQQLAANARLEDILNPYFTIALTHPKYQISAFEFAINSKGSTLLRQRAQREFQNQAEQSGELKTLRLASQRIFQHLKLPTSIRGWKTRLKQLEDEKEQIELRIAAAGQSNIQPPERIRFTEFRKALPKEAVFVDFERFIKYQFKNGKFQNQDCLLAFVVTADSGPKMVDLGELEPVRKAIEQLGQQVSEDHRRAIQNFETAGQKLRERLWLPIENSFAGRKTVLISPSDVLGQIPFAALPGKKKGSYLIEEFDICSVPIPQILPQLIANEDKTETQQSTTEVLLVGDVGYNSRVNATSEENSTHVNVPVQRKQIENWDSLEFTGAEIGSLKKMFQSSTQTYRVVSLTGDQASETNFSQSVTQSNLIHIATHGYFKNGQASNRRLNSAFGQQGYVDTSKMLSPGLSSGLIFAGANNPITKIGDDGIMTAEELSALSLKNANLVTLSACQTGLGKSAGGEGLIGIQRAFQVAGARTTVASLWRVNDRATQLLMEQFYRNMLEKKMSKLRALAEAQRWMMKNFREIDAKESDSAKRGKTGIAERIEKRIEKIPDAQKYLHPRLWAAWNLSGDWR